MSYHPSSSTNGNNFLPLSRHGKPWTDFEIRKVYDLVSKDANSFPGVTDRDFEALAQELHRSPAAVKDKFKHLACYYNYSNPTVPSSQEPSLLAEAVASMSININNNNTAFAAAPAFVPSSSTSASTSGRPPYTNSNNNNINNVKPWQVKRVENECLVMEAFLKQEVFLNHQNQYIHPTSKYRLRKITDSILCSFQIREPSQFKEAVLHHMSAHTDQWWHVRRHLNASELEAIELYLSAMQE